MRLPHLANTAALLWFVAGCYELNDAVPFPCAIDSTCPDGYTCVDSFGCVQTAACSLAAQECDDGDKCTAVFGHDGVGISTCIPASGTQIVGDPCERTIVGVDNCAEGGFCNSATSTDGAFKCRSFCSPDEPCQTGSGCVGLTGDVNAPTAGYCAPICHVNDPICSADRSCRPVRGVGKIGTDPGSIVPTCGTDGTVGAWELCDDAHPCGHNLLCDRFTTDFAICVPTCDSSSACTAGRTCRSSSVNPIGVCSCNLFAGCPLQTACRPYGSEQDGVFGHCDSVGNGVAGATCVDDSNCIASTVCWGNSNLGFRCTRLCDQTHPCTSGSCHLLAGLPNGGGICE